MNIFQGKATHPKNHPPNKINLPKSIALTVTFCLSPCCRPAHFKIKRGQTMCTNSSKLSGTGGSQRDSRELIRANHSQLKPPIFIVRQANSPGSLEFPIRANHPIRANRANRFTRITPLSFQNCCAKCAFICVGDILLGLAFPFNAA